MHFSRRKRIWETVRYFNRNRSQYKSRIARTQTKNVEKQSPYVFNVSRTKTKTSFRGVFSHNFWVENLKKKHATNWKQGAAQYCKGKL